MEYDIIEKAAALAGAAPPGQYARAARLFRSCFPFDYCGIYAWDGEKGVFTLEASSGERKGSVRSYAGDEGVPGLVRRTGRAVEMGRWPEGQALPGVGKDSGLEGFGYAVAYPLMEGGAALRGVLYLKARRAPALDAARRRALGAAVNVLSAALAASDSMARYAAVRKELSETQARLVSSEKLFALVDMASTLAHEIRSPLVSIGGFAGRLRKKLDPASPAQRYVAHIEAEVKRLEKLINGMVRFLRENPVELALDDMNDIMEEAVGYFTEDFISHGITVIKEMHRGPLRVLADREQLKIAFDNLIANAIQSMDAGGTLVVRTQRAGGQVSVSLADSGGGIAPENIDNIFNPFFTTKSCGTGLGLPITNSIITRHNGFVAVTNEAGAGATFLVSLPEAADEGPSPAGC